MKQFLPLILLPFLLNTTNFSEPAKAHHSLESIQKENTISSGDYDELSVAFNPVTRKLTGYYNTETGEGQFSCIFYIEGTLKNSKCKILTYYPLSKNEDLIEGEITLRSDEKIHIKLDEDHGGCWNATPVRFKEGDEFQLSSPRKWIEIRYVDQAKAFFSKEPNETSKTKVYVIKGDILYVTQKTNGYVYCEYRGKKIVTGWIKDALLNVL